MLPAEVWEEFISDTLSQITVSQGILGTSTLSIGNAFLVLHYPMPRSSTFLSYCGQTIPPSSVTWVLKPMATTNSTRRLLAWRTDRKAQSHKAGVVHKASQMELVLGCMSMVYKHLSLCLVL
jgi:hypothetical protein